MVEREHIREPNKEQHIRYDATRDTEVPTRVREEILGLRWNRTVRGIELQDLTESHRLLESALERTAADLATSQEKVRSLETRLADANATIRAANKRISGLKSVRVINADLDPEGYYRVMGLHPAALVGLTEEQASRRVRLAFQASSFIHHPDTGGNAEAMKKLNDAKEVLLDPIRRKVYGK